MMPRRRRSRILGLSSLVCIAVSACTSSAPRQQTLSVGDAAATIVASTFEAATRLARSQSPTPPPLRAATPTLDNPRLYINTGAKCRSGTGPNSRVVASLSAGTTLDMIGKDSAAAAWLVRLPNSATICWVAALESSPGGSFQSLPEITPQPATGKPPAAPTDLRWPFFCSYKTGVLYTIVTDLSWDDPTNDANGFRVYRQDTLIADLPSDVMKYSDTADVVIGTSLTYSVEAYNDVGVSPRLAYTISSVCK